MDRQANCTLSEGHSSGSQVSKVLVTLISSIALPIICVLLLTRPPHAAAELLTETPMHLRESGSNVLARRPVFITDPVSAGDDSHSIADTTYPNLLLTWSSEEAADSLSIDWGDWDGDGDLDLVVGNAGWPAQPNRVYAYVTGRFDLVWSSQELDDTRSVEWGDLDGDGDLDLAVGNYYQPTRIYTNTGENLILAWSSSEIDFNHDVAWGDYDNDGDLDLAVGSYHGPNRVYENHSGTWQLTWSSTEIDYTTDIAWGDWDNDGDLDLAVGNGGDYGSSGERNRVYANTGSDFQLVWTSTETDRTNSVDWGDWDNDGDLDLAVGNFTQPNRVYRNLGGTLDLAWSSPERRDTSSISWGDWDNDGDLDLAAGNLGNANNVYNNDDGVLQLAWSSREMDMTYGAGWGDFDTDGDLDLAVSNKGQPIRVYSNNGGSLQLAWTSSELDQTMSVAWGDWDADGDLDLAVGNGGSITEPIRVYSNHDGRLLLAWSSSERYWTKSVAWGDWDGDGDLDLAVGNSSYYNVVYANDGGHALHVAWTSPEADYTTSVAWGDWDADGDLDLAVGNSGSSPTRVYENDAGVLQLAWSSTVIRNTTSVAWGDWDRDGDLDLAVGNYEQPIMVYANDGSTLQLAWYGPGFRANSVAWGDWDSDGDLDLAVGSYADFTRVLTNEDGTLLSGWNSSEWHYSSSVAWGDWDTDGDLDLAVGNIGEPSCIYANTGSAMQLVWLSQEVNSTRSVSWGDWDHDGDLDLVVGNGSVYGQPNYVYANDARDLALTWSSSETDQTSAVAWGDWDGDGDLDIAAGNRNQPIRVYENDNTALSVVWSSTETDDVMSLAWGDWDSDGDLDLAVGTMNQPNRVYSNENDILTLAWSSVETDDTRSLAWGDVDGDRDLDLAVGNSGSGFSGQPNRLYVNEGASLRLAWSSHEVEETTDLAWGDWDQDGDLDLVVGNASYGRIRVYANDRGALRLAWSSPEISTAASVAWGDWNRDSDLDLAVSNIGLLDNQIQLYDNDGGDMSLIWSSPETSGARSLAWGDYDGDLDLDLAAATGSSFQPNRVYANREEGLLLAWSSQEWGSTSSIEWADWDSDGDLDLLVGNDGEANRLYVNWAANHPAQIDTPSRSFVAYPAGSGAPYFASTVILQGPIIPVRFTLLDMESDAVRFIRAFFSVDGGSTWQPAVASSDTITRNLAASPEGIEHIFNWDVYASGVFGSSDSTIFRLDVYQGFTSPGPYQYAFRSARTLPFRLRGSQVRVMQDGAPAQGAKVYHLRAGQSGEYEPFADSFGHPFETNSVGYLQGFGELGIGDQLVALVPITGTGSYTVYLTSAPATPSGVDPYTVSALGVQTLTVSAENPLVLFNLDISLEWDARNDAPFLAQLNQDIRRASELLYDWSNGQAALGKVTVYHAKGRWQDAHVLIYANNRFRPAATEGGIISDVISETVSIGATSVITYLPGQVAMGPEWNRYGDPGSNLGEDWPRAFAHEMAHYALFLDDNYIGLDDANLLMPVDTCPGAMADPYRDDAASGYGEFHPEADWEQDCRETLSNRNTGRWDWATVGVFYPWLNTTLDNPGPSVLPLSVTEVQVVDPITPTTTLPAPLFLLMQDGNRVFPDARSRSFLFQDGWAIDLGQPSQDRLLARGAQPGDRLCVYDLSASRLGCETITQGDTELALEEIPGWPEITVTPITSVTLAISVTHAPAGAEMGAKLYPLGEPSQGEIALAEIGGEYTGVFVREEPSLVGVIQIWWIDESGLRREIVTDYVIGGNPARIWSGGARIWSGGARIWSGGARIWSGGAPVASADGQVALYSPDHAYGPEWFLTVQASSVEPPPWATLVGKAYRVAASGAAPDLMEMSIAFSYLGSDVPPGEESWLRIYFWDGATWTQLPTRLDRTNNMASAQARGQGVYALMSSIEISLPGPGWTYFGYPVLGTRPVTEALISITGVYTTVDTYDSGVPDPLDRWMNHDAYWPSQLDTLHEMEFGKSYLINLARPVTLFLKGASALETPPEPEVIGPPATYYGAVVPGMGLTPRVGAPVTAWINGRLCGRSVTKDVNGQVMYAINVLPDAAGVTPGCGVPGSTVVFRVDSTSMLPVAAWDKTRTREVSLQHCPDFNETGVVEVGDIIAAAYRWNQHSGSPTWQAQYDWDGDGDVDIVDIQQVTAVWGQACPGIDND